jgi:hypothetical protein
MKSPEINLNAPAALRNGLLKTLAVILTLVAGYYFIDGMDKLITGNAVDLRRRWIDQQYFYNRQNPYDVLYVHGPPIEGAPSIPTSRDSSVIPEVGAPDAGAYPPWSFITGTVLTGAPWPMVKVIYAVINLAAMAVIALWVWRLARDHAATATAVVLFISGTLAIDSGRLTLIQGQFAIILIAMIVAASVMAERNQYIIAGLLLGAAMIKPNITVPFCLCFLIRKQIKPLIVAGLYVVICSLAVWLTTKTDPVEMLHQMSIGANSVARDMPSILKLLIVKFHVPVDTAVKGLAGACLLLATAIMFLCRHRPMLVLFSIAAFVGRVWMYHRPYDDFMLVPILICVGLLAVKPGENRSALLMFILMGITLWLPVTGRIKWPWVFVQHLIWLATLIYILANDRDKKPLLESQGATLAAV